MSDPELPAILGGEPVRPEGPPPWPACDPAVEEALRRAAGDGSWGRYRGPHLEALAAGLRAAFRQSFALPVASGTLALETALRAAGVAAGDEVVMAAYDYEATFLSIHALGALPVLVDGRAGNLAPTAEGIAGALSPRTRAVVASHLHGGVVDMPALRGALSGGDIVLVEDAAQCPGGTLNGAPLGSFGDLAVLSFGGSKLLTAGRGGAILGSRADLIERAKSHLRRGPQEWGVLSELQAAVLLPQLEALGRATERRGRAAARDLAPLRRFDNGGLAAVPAYYKVGHFLPEGPLTRDLFLRALRAEGIAFGPGFRPLHLGRANSRYRAPSPLANAERLHGALVTLHHPVLLAGDSAVDQVERAVRKTYLNAERIAAADLPRPLKLSFDE